MLKKILILSVLVLCASFAKSSNNKISIYDVIWNTPSKDASGTMPIGNGDIGANVYAIEDGALYLLLSKNDAFSYQGDIVKTGRVKIDFSSNPFAKGRKFKQRLDLATGSINIEASGVSINIWADANQNIYNVDIESDKSIKLTASADPWTRQSNLHLYNKIDENEPPVDVRDVIINKDNQIVNYYHVGDNSVFDTDMKFYDVGYMIDKFQDPYRFNTFGNLIQSKELRLDGECLSGSGRDFNIQIFSLRERVEDPNAWVAKIKEFAHNTPYDKRQWESHKNWWDRFWNRGWIMASDTNIPASKRNLFYGEPNNDGMREEADGGALVSQSYNVFRYMMACQSRGMYPTKFNGGIFTQQLRSKKNGKETLSHEDFRLWGRRYTWQNQRLLYWPLLTSGDYDLMQSFYSYYDRILDIRKAITKEWFGHEGAYFRENMCPTGSERDNQPSNGSLPSGAKPSKSAAGSIAKYHHEFYFYSGLELVLMMIEYIEHTEDRFFTDKYLLPLGREVLTFYDRHYQRNSETGKLIIDPAMVCETYWQAKNPAPEISALHVCLRSMLSQNFGTKKDNANWLRLLNELPEIPMCKSENGAIALAPAEAYDYKHNSENGELYPVFPAMLYGVAHGNQDIVIETMRLRGSKNAFNYSCWTQDQIQYAFAGDAKEAVDGLVRRFKTASTELRFPMFGKSRPDSCPDFDHFGSGSVAFQRMLIQENGDKIALFPAWPATWDVNFKLHTHKNTIVEGVVKGGKVISWKVTPSYRAKDVTICKLQ